MLVHYDLFQLLNSQSDCRYLCFGHIVAHLDCPFAALSPLEIIEHYIIREREIPSFYFTWFLI